MPACHCLLCCWQKCNIRNNGQKGGGQEIRERDCGLTPEVITLDRLGLMLAHHDRCHSKLLTADYLLHGTYYTGLDVAHSDARFKLPKYTNRMIAKNVTIVKKKKMENDSN